ncbi:uncharacterized protein LOC132251589 [Alligator mississippiensis]|uniref:uncharacterized protein LOC132251589 n=1 Tax=Alligator mississippiensis TaxID=8496 RepID=UPI002877ACB2|nr:uncharacterized protein LOC132251589 [Alligator mississippiensis]
MFTQMWTLIYFFGLMPLLGIANPKGYHPDCCKCPFDIKLKPLNKTSYEASKSTIINASMHTLSKCCLSREIIITYALRAGPTPVRIEPEPELWSAILRDWPSNPPFEVKPQGICIGDYHYAMNKTVRPKGPPANPWVGNVWVALLKESARALTNHSSLLCALTPVSSDEGVPFLPIPLNRTGIISDWGFNHDFNLSSQFNGSGRLLVAKIKGSICISQQGGGFRVGQSRCQETWISKEVAPRQGAWTHANASYDTFESLPCLLGEEQILVWGHNCTHYQNGTKNSLKRGSLTLALMFSHSSIVNETCGLWWI